MRAVSFNRFQLLSGSMSNLHSRYNFTQDADGLITVNIPLPSPKPKVAAPKFSSEPFSRKCQSSTYKVVETDQHVLVKQENPETELRFSRSIDCLVKRNENSNKHLRKLYYGAPVDGKPYDFVRNVMENIDD